ncbi:hypothetical protein D3C78_985000 [compost metagenome]
MDTVDGRTKTDGDLVIECVGNSWLQGHDFNVALAAEVFAGKTVLVVGDQAKRGIHADADGPLVIDWLDVVAHWHGDERNHVALVGAAIGAGGGMVDIGVSVEHGDTAGDLFALEARHAGRVTENGACIICDRRTPGESSTHPTDALLVDGEASCEDLGGCHGNG